MSELNDCFKEAVCVDVQRIFDSCSDRDCIYDLPITLTQDSAPITDEMDIVRTRCAEVEVTCISVDPVPFKNGFYAVDITYRFKITAEAFTQGFCKNQAGTILCGTALWNTRVILYGSEGTAGVIEEMKREAGSSTPDIVPVQVSQEAMDSGDSAPTIRFINSLIERAFSERASDIHLEPQDGEMVVRMRIDGLLRRVLTVPSELQSTVISRLKIMGGMNIAEHIAASLTLRGWSPRRSAWS